MQFTTTILTLFSLAAAGLAAPTYNPNSAESICLRKSRNTYSAIRNFCVNTGLVSGTPYAKTGNYVGLSHVSIAGHCPANSEWVPQPYCLAQFFDMCAKGDAQGFQTALYGTNGCQEWNIDSSNMKGVLSVWGDFPGPH